MYQMDRTDLSLRHFWDWCNSDSVPRNAFITLRAMIMLPSSMQQISHVNSSMTRIIVVWTTSGITFTWTRVAIYVRKPNVQKQIDKTLQNRTQSCKIVWFWNYVVPWVSQRAWSSPNGPTVGKSKSNRVCACGRLVCLLGHMWTSGKLPWCKQRNCLMFNVHSNWSHAENGTGTHRTLSWFLFRPAPPPQHVHSQKPWVAYNKSHLWSYVLSVMYIITYNL